ncbi:MAG: response regulator [Deltaproteobacteria bacterium]|nr:response regulator [Deltaproteobacteria bacterium]
MDGKEIEFRKRLLQTFKTEAAEHLATISAGLVELERMPPIEVQMEVVETVYRESHSLKGAARAVNVPGIESVCQALESVFAAWKQRRVGYSRELFDTLYLAADTIRSMLLAMEGAAPTDFGELSRLVRELGRFEAGGPSVRILSGRFDKLDKERSAEGPGGDALSAPVAEKPGHDPQKGERDSDPARTTPAQATPAAPRRRIPRERNIGAETVRISTDKLGALLLEAEEMIPVKLAARKEAGGLNELASMVEELRSRCATAARDVPPAHLLAFAAKDSVPAHLSSRLHEFFNWAETHIRQIEKKARDSQKRASANSKALERRVDSILGDMKDAMMLPFSTLLESFPLLVREMASSEGKEADFIAEGETVEIDRRILEEMKDALIHLVRNSVGHGIERAAEREVFKKPRRATIKISVAHLDGNRAEITVSDDGAGIDAQKVREAALKSGLVTGEEAGALTNEEALPLIYASGVSTSPIITDISGRGLGLAIVREKVERLGGSIALETAKGAGTAFRMILPLTVATFRGVLVETEGHTLIIPTGSIDRTLRVRRSEIKTVEGKETITAKGEPLSFAWLGAALDLPRKKKKTDPGAFAAVIVISSGERTVAFGVDSLIDEQEVLVKGLGKQLSRVRNISGAAILGSGRPVPIINVPDLMRSAVRAGAEAPAPTFESERTRSVLVVEDSITSRMLLKNILEGSGYIVKTAVDGLDAVSLLKTEAFDIVISDIEMPRMNGFELTARIRAMKELSSLPVVLVTALESREDRERGIEAGANAYIVKSSFNQSNLLEVVARLV